MWRMQPSGAKGLHTHFYLFGVRCMADTAPYTEGQTMFLYSLLLIETRNEVHLLADREVIDKSRFCMNKFS